MQTQINGKFKYKNTTISQRNNVVGPFRSLIQSINPTKILEIGTAYGGMPLILHDILTEFDMKDVVIRSYDIRKRDTTDVDLAIKAGAKIELIVKNIFNTAYNELIDIDEIQSFVHRPGPTVILCDGGSKKNEFNILSSVLRGGDVIMAHDYAPNTEYFEKNMRNKIWNWLEIQDLDIESVVQQYNLTDFMSSEFLEVAWVCKRKF